MRWFGFKTNLPVHGGREINYNQDKFARPFESPLISANFMFSHGHIIENAGYSKLFDHFFNWEEPF